VAAVLTALPFAGVHVPLLLLDDQVSVLSVLMGIAGLLILGVVVRLLMGVMMRAAVDSVLAVGVLHQIFDASNNNGALVDSLLDGADAGNMTQLAAVVLTVLVAAWLLWRHPGVFAKRRMPLRDSAREPVRLGNHRGCRLWQKTPIHSCSSRDGGDDHPLRSSAPVRAASSAGVADWWICSRVLFQRLFDASALCGRGLGLGIVDRRLGQLGDPISGCDCV
jgi:hypothetical protein